MSEFGILLSEVEPKEETREQAYRRGYRDGWMQAINAIGDMMFDRHMSRDKAHLTCWNHAEEALLDWQRRADSTKRFELPPQP